MKSQGQFWGVLCSIFAVYEQLLSQWPLRRTQCFGFQSNLLLNWFATTLSDTGWKIENWYFHSAQSLRRGWWTKSMILKSAVCNTSQKSTICALCMDVVRFTNWCGSQEGLDSRNLTGIGTKQSFWMIQTICRIDVPHIWGQCSVYDQCRIQNSIQTVF